MIFGIISILVIVVVTILVACNIIKEKYYSFGIALMSAGLIYSITLLGPYVVGSDIQGELSASRLAMANGWDFTGSSAINAITGINITSIVTSLIAPALARTFNIDIVWVYKIILPLFLILVPVVMYYVFQKQTDSKRAFFAALFFILMPVFSLQLAQIAKSMVAELFFALVLLAMVSSWTKWAKAIAITSCALLAIVSHYTIGIALLAYLIGILLMRLFTSPLARRWKLWATAKVSLISLVVILLVSAGGFFVYYHYAFGGAVNQVLSGALRWHGNAVALYAEKVVESASQTTAGSSVLVSSPAPVSVAPISSPAPEPVGTPIKSKSYLYNQEYTVQVGIGLDFFSQPIEGKLFRIIQYLTQLLIVLGIIWLLFRHSQYTFSAEFIAGIGSSLALLLVCIFLPQFSSIINMPRFYQISLFFLSPMLVLGCDASIFLSKVTQKIK